MRIYLYILAGITSALIGWNLGQFFLADFGLLKSLPELILFPCIALSLAVGMVFTEIFISSPTRPKLCWRIALLPISIAGGLGILFGLVAGAISQIVLLPEIFRFDTRLLRIVCWLLIGISTGIAEGVSWRWHSIEAGDSKRFWKRLETSLKASAIASLAAALIFEILRQIGAFPVVQGIADPIGFSILGMLLGFALSKSTSPSYMAALRAGRGFEYTGKNYAEGDPDFDIYSPPPLDPSQNKTIRSDPSEKRNSTDYPLIDKSQDIELNFVGNSEEDKIEEGLSIQLPAIGVIRIGSANKAHIRIPGLPLHAADLELKAREAIFRPNKKFYDTIAINGNKLNSPTEIRLKHNNTITFYPKDEDPNDTEKIYRFVYYNRFLDPQA